MTIYKQNVVNMRHIGSWRTKKFSGRPNVIDKLTRAIRSKSRIDIGSIGMGKKDSGVGEKSDDRQAGRSNASRERDRADREKVA